MHEGRADYAFHMLFGHHGLFSLSPIWFLAVAGMVWGGRNVWRRGPTAAAPPAAAELTMLATLALALTAVVFAFYLFNSNNYGGWTIGLRWLMWLTPLR